MSNPFGNFEYANNGYNFSWALGGRYGKSTSTSKTSYGFTTTQHTLTENKILDFAYGTLQALDLDNDGFIQKEELVKNTANADQTRRMLKAFDSIDQGSNHKGDGAKDQKIDVRELAALLYTADNAAGSHVYNFATGKDGDVDYADLLNVFYSLSGESTSDGGFTLKELQETYKNASFLKSEDIEKLPSLFGDVAPRTSSANELPFNDQDDIEKLGNVGYRFNLALAPANDLQIFATADSDEIKTKKFSKFVDGLMLSLDRNNTGENSREIKINAADFTNDPTQQKLFQALDFDKNGEVSKREIATLVKFIDGITESSSTPSNMGNGTITKNDMERFLTHLNSLSTDNIITSFGREFKPGQATTIADLHEHLKMLSTGVNVTNTTPTPTKPGADPVNFNQYVEKGEKVTKIFKSKIEYSTNEYNSGTIIEMLFKDKDTNQDGILEPDELDINDSGKEAKAIERLFGAASIDREQLFTLFKLVDKHAHGTLKGDITAGDFSSFFSFVKNLNEDETTSSGFDVTANNAFSTIKTVGDLRKFYDRILDNKEDNTNVKEFWYDTELFRKAEEEINSYSKSIYDAYEKLATIDTNHDGSVSKDEWRAQIEKEATDKPSAEKASFKREETEKMNHLFSLTSKPNKVTLAEYTALLATARVKTGSDDPESSINSLFEILYDRTSSDYDAALKTTLKRDIAVFDKSKLFKGLKNQLEEDARSSTSSRQTESETSRETETEETDLLATNKPATGDTGTNQVPQQPVNPFAGMMPMMPNMGTPYYDPFMDPMGYNMGYGMNSYGMNPYGMGGFNSGGYMF